MSSESSSSSPSDVPKPSKTLVYRTVPNGSDNPDLEIDLDIYLPSSLAATGKGHPLVIWFHGGGLLQGNKENLPPHFRRLPRFSLGKGDENVVVISPNYRLAPQTPILDILSDVPELLAFVREKLNDELSGGKVEVWIDTSRICLSGGSAGGYLALIAGLKMPKALGDEEIGGYRGEDGIRCIAPFYPITDLIDPFWQVKTDPVPWADRSIPREEAEPHLNPSDPQICTAVSGGPRSILYPYMLQHALFPSLLFMKQGWIPSTRHKPTPQELSINPRLRQISGTPGEGSYPPIYFAYGGKDDKVQPMEESLEVLREYKGDVTYEFREEADHGFDEKPEEQCEAFRRWLAETLL